MEISGYASSVTTLVNEMFPVGTGSNSIGIEKLGICGFLGDFSGKIF